MVGAPLALKVQEATDYRTTFTVAIGVLVLATNPRRSFRFAPSRIIAREAIVPAVLQFCFLFAWSLVNSFVVVFGVEQGLGSDVGFFFTVYG